MAQSEVKNQPLKLNGYGPRDAVRWKSRSQKRMSSLQQNFFLQILGDLSHVVRSAEITPIILIGPKGKNLFSLRGKAQIRVDDGESALFRHHREKIRGNNVDARERQCVHARQGLNGF